MYIEIDSPFTQVFSLIIVCVFKSDKKALQTSQCRAERFGETT